MLRINQRLSHNRDFIKVFKQGKRHFFGGVLLSYRQNQLDHTRIGFIVGKKYSLSAVKRNRQKRILRSAIQTIYTQLTPGYDIVLSYTNHNKVLPYKEAQKIIMQIFKKTKLLNNFNSKSQ